MKHLIRGLAIASIALAQGGFNGPGRYEIANVKTAKVMALDRIDQTTVMQLAPRGTDQQRWDIESAGEGTFYIRSAVSGKALEAARNFNGAPLICARFDRNPNQQWKIQPGKDGNAMMVSRWGR